MGSAFDKFRKGLGDLLQAQQLKSELNKVLERRERAIQLLGEHVYRLIEDGLMPPPRGCKDDYLDARTLEDRARELKKLIAEGYAGPVPPPAKAPTEVVESEIETRPASVDDGPPGPDEAPPPPPEVRARMGTCACGAVIPAGARYCPECGMPTEPGAGDKAKSLAPPRKCPHCGSEVPPGATFCPECGGHADQEVYEV